MKGIYLASYKAEHPGHNIKYQDINGKRDIPGDMLQIDLTPYDYIIATPPCNYWSRANYRRESSNYSQKTKHLLPNILKKLCKQDKPFIVENVKNANRFTKYGLFNLPCFIYEIGRHTYWTNIFLSTNDIEQNSDNIQNTPQAKRQGGNNVHNVIEQFLKDINAWQQHNYNNLN